MKSLRKTRTLTLGLVAATLTALVAVATPASADMSSAETAEAEAKIAQVSTYVDDYVVRKGTLPSPATVEAMFPYPDDFSTVNISWAYVPVEGVGYCLDTFAFRDRTFTSVALADFRFYESTTKQVFTPTQSFMGSNDPTATGACGDWSTAGFPDTAKGALDPTETYPPGFVPPPTPAQVRAALKSDVVNAATAAETFFTDHPTKKPTMADLKRYGFHASQGNTVVLRNGKRAGAYCLRGTNANDGLPVDQAVWYDSANAGLRIGKVSTGRRSTCARVF